MRRTARDRTRRGTVLLVVLVLIALLTLGVYGFTDRMLAEQRAAAAHAKFARSRALADSGVALAAAVVDAANLDPDQPPPLFHDPVTFGGVPLAESTDPAGTGYFTVVAPAEGGASGAGGRAVRFGLVEETSKIDLNGLSTLELEPDAERELLMGLPNMTEDTADAILDFIDDDEEVRPFGAESAFYQGLAPPYAAANGPLESLDELLLVAGVTPALLYGEDANRNGLLDPAEDDGPATPPLDNADGLLDTGWAEYLTVHGGEPNVAADGGDRINLNEGVLTELFDQLEEEFSTDVARFVVAYRLAGPVDPEASSDAPDPNAPLVLDGDGLDPNVPTATEQETIDNAAGALAKALSGTAGQDQGTVTRAGMDLADGPQFEIGSFYDLMEREVTIEVDGAETTLTSPFTPAELASVWLDRLTTFDTKELRGRLNVNSARLPALLGVPGMTEQLAASIDGDRMIGPSGEVRTEQFQQKRTTYWLYERGLTDLATLRRLDRYVTVRGGFYRVRSVGFFASGGPAARVEAVLDGRSVPARVLELRDLSHLGRGYAVSELLPR